MIYFAFDLLYLDGYDLRNVALEKRRELLQQVLAPGPADRISDAFPDAGEALLEAARENGLEGIVANHTKAATNPAAAGNGSKSKSSASRSSSSVASPSRRAIDSISARWCWESTRTANCAG